MPISRAAVEAGKVDLSDVIDTKGPRLRPTHPGRILRDEFLKPMRITAYRLAADIGVPANRITAILAGKRSITGDTALRLARYFGVSAEFWSGLQSEYDLRMARRQLGTRLEREVKVRAA